MAYILVFFSNNWTSKTELWHNSVYYVCQKSTQWSILQDKTLYSGALAHVFQIWDTAFRDGILRTLLVTSAYLSCFCPSIILNQSAKYLWASTRIFYRHRSNQWLYSPLWIIFSKPGKMDARKQLTLWTPRFLLLQYFFCFFFNLKK